MRPAALAALMAAALGGCASQSVSIRSVPPENPAAENAAAVESAAAFAAAAALVAEGETDQSVRESKPAPPPITEAVFLPVSHVYRRIPSPIRSGVHNFFVNLSEVDSVINYSLQWRLKLGVRSLGRFLINSTLGVGGLIDVAAKLKLPAAPTGASTTLAKWGVHPGPYLVIPLLGPSTLRDGFGFLADYGTSYAIDLGHLYRGSASWGLGGTNAVDQRSNIDFRYYATGSPFEYENVRFLYVRKRLIEDAGLRGK
jgi:phospholipid-binding lipoprotein MlaA